MYYNTSLPSGLELIDASDDINVSFMLEGESSRIVVYITATMESARESVADGPSLRNSWRNALLDQDQNIQVVPDPELVLEHDMEDIEPPESSCKGVGNEFDKGELGRVWASCKAEGVHDKCSAYELAVPHTLK
ncbi:hypothetical protein AMTR_s00023p00074270 [Amborella trichopoda]|uniref:Uncharacterized protein n=1 Tax=Amborella trichopoda TaxID=13333 RepID=W1NJC4_AMBTC|nr:hypothetical protein AMTR_s00023p00074270 [Amborella trichopoda]